MLLTNSNRSSNFVHPSAYQNHAQPFIIGQSNPVQRQPLTPQHAYPTIGTVLRSEPTPFIGLPTQRFISSNGFSPARISFPQIRSQTSRPILIQPQYSIIVPQKPSNYLNVSFPVNAPLRTSYIRTPCFMSQSVLPPNHLMASRGMPKPLLSIAIPPNDVAFPLDIFQEQSPQSIIQTKHDLTVEESIAEDEEQLEQSPSINLRVNPKQQPVPNSPSKNQEPIFQINQEIKSILKPASMLGGNKEKPKAFKENSEKINDSVAMIEDTKNEQAPEKDANRNQGGKKISKLKRAVTKGLNAVSLKNMFNKMLEAKGKNLDSFYSNEKSGNQNGTNLSPYTTDLKEGDIDGQKKYINYFHAKSINVLEKFEEEDKTNPESAEKHRKEAIAVLGNNKNVNEHHHHHSHQVGPTVKLEHPDLPNLHDDLYARDFLEIYEKHKKLGTNWVDPDFGPDENSLFEKNSVKREVWKDLVWKRPKEFFPDGFAIFSFEASNLAKATLSKILKHSVTLAAIEMEDIVQGALGDCYFLSSLASLATKPSRIRNLFNTTKTNEMGIYCLRLNHEGIWQAVYVDDYFPCWPDSGPAFSQSKPGEYELWVLLLEKAWAKAYGNYERIEAGFSRDVLGDLTGAPTRIVWNDDPTLWEQIADAISRDYLLTAGAAEEADIKKCFLDKGMVTGHAYSLIGCYEVLGERLVKLRNPWGRGEWEGPWGDKDPIWQHLTKKEKDQIGYQNRDDGTFFMGFDVFKELYPDVEICMIHDDYVYDACEITLRKNETVYLEIEIIEEGEYFLTILQNSFRKMVDQPNYDYSKATLVMAKKNNQNLEFIEANSMLHREVFVGPNLKPGVYICSFKVAWCWTDKGKFAFTCYGVDKTHFKIVGAQENFLERVYLSKVAQSPNKQKLQGFNAEKTFELYQSEGYGVYYVKNNEAKELSIELTIKNKKEDIKAKKKWRYKDNKARMSVPPKGRSIIIFRISKVKNLIPDFQEKVMIKH